MYVYRRRVVETKNPSSAAYWIQPMQKTISGPPLSLIREQKQNEDDVADNSIYNMYVVKNTGKSNKREKTERPCAKVSLYTCKHVPPGMRL